jgi:hypothetical protein
MFGSTVSQPMARALAARRSAQIPPTASPRRQTRRRAPAHELRRTRSDTAAGRRPCSRLRARAWHCQSVVPGTPINASANPPPRRSPTPTMLTSSSSITAGGSDWRQADANPSSRCPRSPSAATSGFRWTALSWVTSATKAPATSCSGRSVLTPCDSARSVAVILDIDAISRATLPIAAGPQAFAGEGCHQLLRCCAA